MKNSFDALVEQVLCEMPYVEVSNQIFDLEVEKYKNTPEVFVQKLKSILSGKKHVDKYGNVMQLATPEQKTHFLKFIKNNVLVQSFLSGTSTKYT